MRENTHMGYLITLAASIAECVKQRSVVCPSVCL